MRKTAQDFQNALVYLNRAVAIHPRDLTARKLMASLKLQTGAVEEAVQLLQQVVADAPDSVDAHVQLATAYNRLKRKDDAEREREIVDRLNRELQDKQAGLPADGAPAPRAASPPPGGGEGPHR
jgi:tetratricopeptide (TPR) repeat protein